MCSICRPRRFEMWIKVAILAVLIGHGLGHVMAPQAAFVPPGALPRNSHAIIGSGLTIVSPAGKSLALLWLIPMMGFLAGSYGLWTGQEWWRLVLGVASLASIAVVLPWWGVMPAFSYVGAIAVDIAVLVAILTPWGAQLAMSFER
jgi:hypothetical protein